MGNENRSRLVRNAAAVVEAQMAVARGWLSSAGYRWCLRDWQCDPDVPSWLEESAARKHAHTEGTLVMEATPVFVTAPMVDLVEHAAVGLEWDLLRMADLPWRSAFVMFERPTPREWTFKIGPLDEDAAPMSALHWGVAQIVRYNGTYRPEAVAFQPYMTIESAGLAVPELPEWYEMEMRAGRLPRWGGLLPFDSYGWTPDIPWAEVAKQDGSLRDGEMSVARIRQRQFYLALVLLMQQKIATVQEARLPRSAQRRLARDGLEASTVKIVRLRRPASRSGEEVEGSEVEWSHRWIVNGHWRMQWFPSMEEHRPLWISPHVKGPADKPLVVKDTVYVFDR